MNLAREETRTTTHPFSAAFMMPVASFLLLSAALFVLISMDDGRSYPGVVVAHTSVGDLHRTDVYSRLREIEKSRVLAPVTLEFMDRTWTLYPAQVRARMDVLGAYDQILRVGRGDTLQERLDNLIGAPTGLVEISPHLACDDVELIKYVSWLASRIDRDPRPAEVSWQPDGTMQVTPEAVGYRLDRAATLEAIRNAILTMSPDRRIKLPVTEIKPELKASDIAKWPELTIIGRFDTKFDPENALRTYNIQRSAHSMDGYVLLPGQEFSFNRVVGPRIPLRGYREADVIVNGRLVPDFGGGVCQVSSTLYNAVLLADLQVTMRYNHSLILNYIKPGTDATVVYDYRDFRFRNNTDGPVVVAAWVYDDTVDIALFGKPQPGKSVEIVTDVLEEVKPPIVYEEDPTLPLGKQVVERWGAPDLLVQTRKVVMQDGQVISDRIISLDRYNHAPLIIRVGTGEMVAESDS
jgi:vancomycin resistance protein YoaR